MIYAIETKAETTTTKGLLRTEMKTLRRIIDNNLRDRIRNIREIQDKLESRDEHGNTM